MKYYYHFDKVPSHLIFNVDELVGKRHDFFEPDYQFQLSTIKLKADDFVNPHIHLLNKKSNFEASTHEIWYVIKGNASVELFSENKIIDTINLRTGCLLITFPNGGHSIKVKSKNFIFLEFKNTPFYPEMVRKFKS